MKGLKGKRIVDSGGLDLMFPFGFYRALVNWCGLF
jgi:hypothetical protein